LLQLKLALKQTLKSKEVGGKMSDCRMPQLPASGVSPHDAKNESMVIYKFWDAPSLINHLLYEGSFPHILKHQINTVCNPLSPDQ
jgi:hypothetical protein